MNVSARASILLLLIAAAAQLSACSLVVHFKDAPPDAATGAEDETESGSIIPSGDASIVTDGTTSSTDAAVTDDTSTPIDTGPTPFTCQGKADGTQVPDTGNRCCGYVSTPMGTNANCGGCNVACNTAKGQTCVNRDGHYYCIGCFLDGGAGGSDCWTGCCTKPILSPEGICAPEFPCGFVVPQCDDNACQSHGAQCHTSGLAGTYCE